LGRSRSSSSPDTGGETTREAVGEVELEVGAACEGEGRARAGKVELELVVSCR
jgi:hypothetical protein